MSPWTAADDDPPVAGRRQNKPRPSIHDGPPSLLYTVKQVELAIRHHLDDLLKPAGVTALQYTALTVLQRRDHLSLTELARNSFVTVPSMADLIRPLYEQQLISRRPDPNHGRRQLISLTPAGQELLGQYQDQVVELERRMVAALSDHDVDRLKGMLADCRDRVGLEVVLTARKLELTRTDVPLVETKEDASELSQ